MPEIKLDIVIFGGGIQGLWTLRVLNDLGYSAILFEKNALGHGQTVAAQGILHGGLKYTLDGKLSESAKQVAMMPERWNQHLSGEKSPDLSDIGLRSEYCHLWRIASLSSRLGLWGAQVGLNVKPQKVDAKDKPPLLEGWQVKRLDEKVISPPRLLQSLLAPVRIFTYQYSDLAIAEFEHDHWRLQIRPGSEQPLVTIHARHVLLTAGNGNQTLLETFFHQKDPGVQMQQRPLQLALIRGKSFELPPMNAHCLDGQKTRVTITTEVDHDEHIWQVGGDLSEKGALMPAIDLLRMAKKELQLTLPNLELAPLKWATWSGNRAELKTGDGKRPSQPAIIHKEAMSVIWPTKMVLVPAVVDILSRHLQTLISPSNIVDHAQTLKKSFQAATVAAPPWRSSTHWYTTDELS